MAQQKRRAAKAFRRALRRLAADVDAHFDGALAGDDIEELHELRVALRRTRVVLANAKHVIAEPERRRFSRGFRDLAAATSETRDLDVAMASWRRLMKDQRGSFSPLEAAVAQRRRRAQQSLACTLQSEQVANLRREWHEYLDGPIDTAPRLARTPIIKVAKRRRRRALERLHRSMELATTPETRHLARKDAKRLRYLTETFDVYKKRWRQRELKRLTKVQDELGRTQDARVQLDLLAAISDDLTDPAAITAAATLKQLLERRIDATA